MNRNIYQKKYNIFYKKKRYIIYDSNNLFHALGVEMLVDSFLGPPFLIHWGHSEQ